MERSNYQTFQPESKTVVREQAYDHLFFSPDFHSALNHILNFQTNQGIVANQEGFGIYGGEQLKRIEEYLHNLCENAGYYPIVSVNVAKYIDYLQSLVYSFSLPISEMKDLTEQKIQFLLRLIRLDKANQGNYNDRFCDKQWRKYSKGILDHLISYINYNKESRTLSQLNTDFIYTSYLLEISGTLKELYSQRSENRMKQLRAYFVFDPAFFNYCQKLLNENSPLLKEPVILETIYYILNVNHECLKKQPMLSFQKLGDGLDDFKEQNEYLRAKIFPLKIGPQK